MVQMAPKGGKRYFFNKYGATLLRFSSRRHEPTEYAKPVLESYQHVLTCFGQCLNENGVSFDSKIS